MYSEKEFYEAKPGRILSQNVFRDNNTWETGLCNNDIIIGATGTGKTRSYVKPNLMQHALFADDPDYSKAGSLIVADTKGSLYHEVGPLLREHGYEVINLDFVNFENNVRGYNPLLFISKDEKTGTYSDHDIRVISDSLVSETGRAEDAFWLDSAKDYLAAFIGYTLEIYGNRDVAPTLSLTDLLSSEFGLKIRRYKLPNKSDRDDFTVGEMLTKQLESVNPHCMALNTFRKMVQRKECERTYQCVQMFIDRVLNPLTESGASRLFLLDNPIRFEELSEKRTVIFLSISDSDKTAYPLANLFYTQAIQQLLHIAENSPGYRLKVPVRLILDDFAANVVIPDFDRLISIIRSREISVSVILQSINQLSSIYGCDRAKTILSNCDNWLFLGSQERDTCDMLSLRADKPIGEFFTMPLNKSWLFTRSFEGREVTRYDVTRHPLYDDMIRAEQACSNSDIKSQDDVEDVLYNEFREILSRIEAGDLTYDVDVNGSVFVSTSLMTHMALLIRDVDKYFTGCNRVHQLGQHVTFKDEDRDELFKIASEIQDFHGRIRPCIDSSCRFVTGNGADSKYVSKDKVLDLALNVHKMTEYAHAMDYLLLTYKKAVTSKGYGVETYRRVSAIASDLGDVIRKLFELNYCIRPIADAAGFESSNHTLTDDEDYDICENVCEEVCIEPFASKSMLRGDF